MFSWFSCRFVNQKVDALVLRTCAIRFRCRASENATSTSSVNQLKLLFHASVVAAAAVAADDAVEERGHCRFPISRRVVARPSS